MLEEPSEITIKIYTYGRMEEDTTRAWTIYLYKIKSRGGVGLVCGTHSPHEEQLKSYSNHSRGKSSSSSRGEVLTLLNAISSCTLFRSSLKNECATDSTI